MKVLGRGLVFQPVLVTQTCTYNSKYITLTLQIFHQKRRKKNPTFFKKNITTPPPNPPPPPPPTTTATKQATILANVLTERELQSVAECCTLTVGPVYWRMSREAEQCGWRCFQERAHSNGMCPQRENASSCCLQRD